MDYEANVTPSTHSQISTEQGLMKIGAGIDGFRTTILQGERIFSTGENGGDSGVLSAELKPSNSITGAFDQPKL